MTDRVYYVIYSAFRCAFTMESWSVPNIIFGNQKESEFYVPDLQTMFLFVTMVKLMLD